MNKYIKMRCENCGAEMDVDPEKKILFCPYCGSKTLVEESDEIKKAKLDSAVRIHEVDKETEARREISRNEMKTKIADMTSTALIAAIPFITFILICLIAALA